MAAGLPRTRSGLLFAGATLGAADVFRRIVALLTAPACCLPAPIHVGLTRSFIIETTAGRDAPAGSPVAFALGRRFGPALNFAAFERVRRVFGLVPRKMPPSQGSPKHPARPAWSLGLCDLFPVKITASEKTPYRTFDDKGARIRRGFRVVDVFPAVSACVPGLFEHAADGSGSPGSGNLLLAFALDGPVDGRFRVWMVPDSSHAEEPRLGDVVVCFRSARPDGWRELSRVGEYWTDLGWMRKDDETLICH
ncbi:hypothetical protein HPB47_011573 [Ixodes persulcatus]|uniref:Uncharacterized protein n=1 Tax=Ixodes persulcatus TaxID=34615 RepID=A0AC60NW91_IXOPE|nr:hypothetical protein HPB47_011573 [Ixodes persulcatus]